MKPKLYGIKNCDSVKKALKFFKNHDIDFDFIDLKLLSPSEETLLNWSNQATLAKLFNNRSRTYKDLGLSTMELSDTDKISWMHKAPLLIKRPVIEYNENLLVGFDEATYLGVFTS